MQNPRQKKISREHLLTQTKKDVEGRLLALKGIISQRADSSVLRDLGIKSQFNFKNLLAELQQLGDKGDAIPVVKELKRYILIFLQVQDELDNYEEYRKEAKIEKKGRDVEDKMKEGGQWETAFVAEINRRDLPHRNQKANLAELEGDFGDDDRRDVKGRLSSLK